MSTNYVATLSVGVVAVCGGNVLRPLGTGIPLSFVPTLATVLSPFQYGFMRVVRCAGSRSVGDALYLIEKTVFFFFFGPRFDFLRSGTLGLHNLAHCLALIQLDAESTFS